MKEWFESKTKKNLLAFYEEQVRDHGQLVEWKPKNVLPWKRRGESPKGTHCYQKESF